MTRNIIILLVTMLCGAGLTYLFDYTQNKPPSASVVSDAGDANGEAVPDFTFKTLDGTERAIQDFKGKIVVLNFWASWCAPCVKEFPLFLEMASEYKDNLVFIGLSSDHDLTAMNRFLDKMRKAHHDAMAADNVLIAVDEDAAVTQDVFQTFRLPETIIIDQNGLMREKLVGASWNYADIKKIVTMIEETAKEPLE